MSDESKKERKPKTSKILTLKFADPVEQRIICAAAIGSGISAVTGTEEDIREMFLRWCKHEVEPEPLSEEHDR